MGAADRPAGAASTTSTPTSTTTGRASRSERAVVEAAIGRLARLVPMEPSRDEILQGARAGHRPRAAPSGHRARHGPRRPDRRRRRCGHDRADRRRLSAAARASSSRSPRALAPVDGVERVALEFDVHVAGGEGGADDRAPRRRHRAHEGISLDRSHARDRGRERQRRGRQVVADGQPRRRVQRARPARRGPRRGRLRPLDPAPARDPPAARLSSTG